MIPELPMDMTPTSLGVPEPLYPERVQAYRSKRGTYHATPEEAIRLDMTTELELALLTKGYFGRFQTSFADRSEIVRLVLDNLKIIIPLVKDYPLQKDAP